MALARTTDPQSSHDAANTIHVNGPDKNRPTTDLERAIKEAAEDLVVFTDPQLVEAVQADSLRKFGVSWSEQRVRCARKWIAIHRQTIRVIGKIGSHRAWQLIGAKQAF
jgi:hypothetical protein